MLFSFALLAYENYVVTEGVTGALNQDGAVTFAYKRCRGLLIAAAMRKLKIYN
jgi:hypothetical protein